MAQRGRFLAWLKRGDFCIVAEGKYRETSMLEGLAVSAFFKFIVTTAVGAKVVGFVLSFVTSKANRGMRLAFIEHVDHVLENVTKTEGVIEPEAIQLLRGHIEILRAGVDAGWIEPSQSSSLLAIMKFLSWEHLRGTGEGFSRLTLAHLNAVGEWTALKSKDMSDAANELLKRIQPPASKK